MYTQVRGGTRGGAAEFKWSDVSADKDREHYLGHSINAPTGRWQKNKDVHWYNRDAKDSEAERREEIAKVKQAEEDAMAAALGFIPVSRVAEASGSSTKSPEELEAEKQREEQEKEEKRRKKEEKRQWKEEKRERKERKRAEREDRHSRAGSRPTDYARPMSRSRTPPYERRRSRSPLPPRHRYDSDRPLQRRSRSRSLDRHRSVSPRRNSPSRGRYDREASNRGRHERDWNREEDSRHDVPTRDHGVSYPGDSRDRRRGY